MFKKCNVFGIAVIILALALFGCADNPKASAIKTVCEDTGLTNVKVSISGQNATIKCSGFSELSEEKMFGFFMAIDQIEEVYPGYTTVSSDGHKYTMKWENKDPEFDGYVFCDEEKIYEAPTAGFNPKIGAVEDKFEEYIKEHNVTLNNLDVQYDQENNYDVDFTLKGTAKLSDYYNYGYDGVEGTHFCLEVTPTGGSYSDTWYIYCERGSFNKVFEKAKDEGSISVRMVCRITRGGSNQSRMAELQFISY